MKYKKKLNTLVNAVPIRIYLNFYIFRTDLNITKFRTDLNITKLNLF